MIVIIAHINGTEFGSYEFETLPHLGEHISITEDVAGSKIYEVVQVLRFPKHEERLDEITVKPTFPKYSIK